MKTKDPADTTLMTLYWQMGTANDRTTSVFQWVKDNVTADMKTDIDVVALSTWIEDAPLGIAHDEVFERLHAMFPAEQVAMGELGYWNADTTKAWWWRSQTGATTTVREQLAEHMYVANLAFPYSVGGVFWWYYIQEMHGPKPLWTAVRDVHATAFPG